MKCLSWLDPTELIHNLWDVDFIAFLKSKQIPDSETAWALVEGRGPVNCPSGSSQAQAREGPQGPLTAATTTGPAVSGFLCVPPQPGPSHQLGLSWVLLAQGRG